MMRMSRRPNTVADPSFLDFPLLRLLLFLLMLSAFHISAFRRHHCRSWGFHRYGVAGRSISSSFQSRDLPAEDALQQTNEHFHRTTLRGRITNSKQMTRSHAVRDWSECRSYISRLIRLTKLHACKEGKPDYSRILLAKEFIPTIVKRVVSIKCEGNRQNLQLLERHTYYII